MRQPAACSGGTGRAVMVSNVVRAIFRPLKSGVVLPASRCLLCLLVLSLIGLLSLNRAGLQDKRITQQRDSKSRSLDASGAGLRAEAVGV